MDRRNFLQIAGLGASGLAAGCRVDGDLSLRAPKPGSLADTGSVGLDTGDTAATSDTGSPADTGAPVDTDPADPTLADTGPALDDRLPRSIMSTAGAELDVELSVLSGTLPSDMDGHAFIVHPIPEGDGAPLFVGEGVVMRLDFRSDGVGLKSRIMRSPCHYADVATQGSSSGFSTVSFARMSWSLGMRAFLNTGFQPMGDRLLVTSDAARPWEIDPETLEMVTPVGRQDEWSTALPSWIESLTNWPFPLVMSTAHPGWDHEAEHLYTVAYGMSVLGSTTYTHLVRWDGRSDLEAYELVDEEGQVIEITQSVHQLAVTRDHVVLNDTAFVVELEKSWDEAAMREQSPDTILYIVRKSDLRGGGGQVTAHTVLIPRESVHFLVDYDDSDGIVLHLSHNPAADPSEVLQEGDVRADTGAPVPSDLLGLVVAPTDLGCVGRHVVDTSSFTLRESTVVYDEAFWGGPALVTWRGSETPERHEKLWWASVGLHGEQRVARVEDAYADHPYREVALDDLVEAPPRLSCVDVTTLEVLDLYEAPAGRLLLSPVFVPRAGSTASDDGYIVATMISDDEDTAGSSGDEIWVFDARDLAQGPVARLGHTQLDLPFTLHTTWMPSVARRTASYQVSIRDDLWAAVSEHDMELQALFELYVYPPFE